MNSVVNCRHAAFSRRRPSRVFLRSDLVAHSDGGARGNPGPAGYGVVIEDQSGRRSSDLANTLDTRPTTSQSIRD